MEMEEVEKEERGRPRKNALRLMRPVGFTNNFGEIYYLLPLQRRKSECIPRRRLAQDLSHPLITMLQQECTRASCPEMKAGEWLYLCVAHGNEGAMEVCKSNLFDIRRCSMAIIAAMLRH